MHGILANKFEGHSSAKLSDDVKIGHSPRVAIFSLRHAENHVSRACGYEFEDLIASELDDALLLSPRYEGMSRLALKAKRWIARHSTVMPSFGFNAAPSLLDQDVDLFFFSAAQFRDLDCLETVKNWRKRSRFAVCWLQELWIADIPRLGARVDALNMFDHVICPFHFSTEALRDRLSVPVTYIPWGVDTEVFCPWPTPPHQAIDICGIGAVAPATHANLIDYADRTGKFYFYNTVQGRATMDSHQAHRHNYAGTLKRSKYFLTYKAKIGQTDERLAQEEFGLRYFEGIAAGAVLLGDRIESPAFTENFGWEDAVIEMPYSAPDAGAFIDQLNTEPDRISAARSRNVIHALARHDHLHRWQEVLKIAGMDALPKLQVRQEKLAGLSAMVEAANPGSSPHDGFSPTRHLKNQPVLTSY
jgi:hypothetical protein